MFKWLRNPFYRKAVLLTLAILLAAIIFALLQAAWRDFQGDVDRVFPGGQSDRRNDNGLNWGEPAPANEHGLPSVDDFDW